jgi:hypothetical protein
LGKIQFSGIYDSLQGGLKRKGFRESPKAFPAVDKALWALSTRSLHDGCSTTAVMKRVISNEQTGQLAQRTHSLLNRTSAYEYLEIKCYQASGDQGFILIRSAAPCTIS